MIQMHAFCVFLGIASVFTVVFIYVGLSTRRARDVDHDAAYGLRKKLLFVVVAVLGLAMGATLGKTPYRRVMNCRTKLCLWSASNFPSHSPTRR